MPFRIQFPLVCDSNSALNIRFLFPQTYRVFHCIGQDIDEDELNRELEELEQEELDKELIGVGPSSGELPEVPTGEIIEPAAASEKKKGTLTIEPLLLPMLNNYSQMTCLLLQSFRSRLKRMKI